ncbi:MAG: transcriptional regulator [Alphaproteobacteria bacterium]|nr:transcriptional regulator [Alphaproteobacteria bacterium]
MQINRPIRNDREHKAALREIEGLMDAKAGTPRGDRLDLIATLVEVYETRRWPIENPDPIEAINFMMEQKGLSRRDPETIIGGRGRVAEILNRKRSLTLPMIRGLAKFLDLPADILVQSYPTKAAA